MYLYNMRIMLILLSLFTVIQSIYSQNNAQQKMLNKINMVRKSGCTCGFKKMKPVEPLSWNNKLRKSAYRHAKDMHKKNYFSHYDEHGNIIRDRINNVGYFWQYIGENLGMGQKSFDEVLKDWLESPSHCQMIMSPKVSEIGVAQKDLLWVSHFAMPYKGTNYSEVNPASKR